MRKSVLFICLLFSLHSFSQTDTSKWLRAFPITGYIVNIDDSTRLVQLQLPDGYSLKEKQLGLVKGVYTNSPSDTVQKGYGRCGLIKDDYYYFAIGHNTSGISLMEGDLLYTFTEKTGIYYGQVPQLAAHFIELQNVYEQPLYDRYTVFYQWTETDERTLIDSIVQDIRFTGDYFMKNDPSMDKLINGGAYKGRKVLNVMTECREADVTDFIGYMIARPRLYAGRKWKVSEVFATWLANGAPAVLK